LDKSFEMQAKEGASRKALIFTESTKTQAYLKEYLDANGYEGKIVLFNGRGSDPKTTQIYKNW
jgi:ERCC4-related helicase